MLLHVNTIRGILKGLGHRHTQYLYTHTHSDTHTIAIHTVAVHTHTNYLHTQYLYTQYLNRSISSYSHTVTRVFMAVFVLVYVCRGVNWAVH